MAIDERSRPRGGREAVPDVPMADLAHDLRDGERGLATVPAGLVATERVSGGTLVYVREREQRDVDGERRRVVTGRWLVGVQDVTDWDALYDDVQARGHGAGLFYRLPVLAGGGSA